MYILRITVTPLYYEIIRVGRFAPRKPIGSHLGAVGCHTAGERSGDERADLYFHIYHTEYPLRYSVLKLLIYIYIYYYYCKF